MYHAAGRRDDAEAAFRHALRIAPSHGVLSNLGTIQYEAGRYAEAARMYRQAAELKPEDYRNWGNLGDALVAQGGSGGEATEMCIVTDGDEGLLASYDDVQFRAPVRAGDVLEINAELVRAGNRSRVLHFTAYVVARGAGTATRPGAATRLDPPLLATEATGTVVVPG